MPKPKIKVDVVSDVVCPWCYIGKRRLEKAIDSLQDKYDFEITYHPFELNPGMPLEGVNQKEYLSAKFGGAEQYEKITSRTVSVAAEEGLQFDFNKQKVSPNTRNAHRIIQYAQQEEKQPEVKEAFMKAYFEDGVDLSKKENLTDVAVKAGLSKENVDKLLSGNDGLAEVVHAEQELQKLGITGVPFYIINSKYGVSGAQPTSSFIEIFDNVSVQKEMHDDACEVEGENC